MFVGRREGKSGIAYGQLTFDLPSDQVVHGCYRQNFCGEVFALADGWNIEGREPKLV